MNEMLFLRVPRAKALPAAAPPLLMERVASESEQEVTRPPALFGLYDSLWYHSLIVKGVRRPSTNREHHNPGGHAAASRNRGYQSRNAASRSPLSTRVRV